MSNKDKLTFRIEVRVTEYEKNFIKGLADIYSNGNISMLLVYAAFNFVRKFLEESDFLKSKRRKGIAPPSN